MFVGRVYYLIVFLLCFMFVILVFWVLFSLVIVNYCCNLFLGLCFGLLNKFMLINWLVMVCLCICDCCWNFTFDCWLDVGVLVLVCSIDLRFFVFCCLFGEMFWCLLVCLMLNLFVMFSSVFWCFTLEVVG